METIKDLHLRTLNYVRISVTDRCNFRCHYCMPEEGVPGLGHDAIMRYEEITFLCKALTNLGVKRIRFTGGEPLVRRGFSDYLLEFSSMFPHTALALTSNGALLEKYAPLIAKAGVSSLNVSLDTLDPCDFYRITRGGNLGQVLAGLEAAKNSSIGEIKLNSVLIKGQNHHQVAPLLEYAKKNGFQLRLIEFMPLEDGVWSKEKFISGEEAISGIGGSWEQEADSTARVTGPARYYVNKDTGQRIGIIAAVSSHFCASCNRLRISAIGGLKTCLFESREIPLMPILKGCDYDALVSTIKESALHKPGQWMDVRDGKLAMSHIGG